MASMSGLVFTPRRACQARIAEEFGVLVVFAIAAWSHFSRVVVHATPENQDRPVSILVLDMAGDGYQLTGPEDGVQFDRDGDGGRSQVSWTARGGDDGFLFLDANRNGRVDHGRELLGDGWRLPDGSRSPSVDSTLVAIQGFPLPPRNPAPPGIAAIDDADDVYRKLRLWRDVNHDGGSQLEELQPLDRAQITEILLTFRRLGPVTDSHGNIRRFEGAFQVRSQGVDVTHRMVDVVLARK